MNCTLLAAAWLTRSNWMWIVVPAGLILGVVGVGYLMRKRWPAIVVALAKHPFAKYVILSVVAHIVIVIWLLTSQLFRTPALGPGPPAVVVQLGPELGSEEAANPEPARQRQPWDAPPVEAVTAPAPELEAEPMAAPTVERPVTIPAEDLRVDSPLADLATVTEPEEVVEAASPWADAPKPLATMELAQMASIEQSQNSPAARAEPPAEQPAEEPRAPGTKPTTLLAEPVELPHAEALSSAHDELWPSGRDAIPPNRDLAAADTLPTADQAPMEAATSESTGRPRAQLLPPTMASSMLARETRAAQVRTDGKPLPSIYRDRWATDRLEIARRRGGSEETEQAVQAALKWLAAAQSSDGRWDSSRYGGGQAVLADTQDRMGAGKNADTGITGLALLAFLGAGHTHLEGEYAETIRRGLDFLLEAQQQRNDASLVGTAGGYAAMYCHGIATLALSEAYSMTGDPQLRAPVQKAIEFTLRAQDRESGGWRYQPGQAGDTSQFGWQLMALTSAHYSGIRIPHETWTRAGGFLNSVAVPGSKGGLASYRPGQRPTAAMTAEALLCRLFLRTPLNHPLIAEAAERIVQLPPGKGRVNYYYWYYGTLSLYHLQDSNWDLWNAALQNQLLPRQADDGSWDANSVWGPSGGRVYSTALATMTLEVYYRYRPLVEPRQPQRAAWNRD